MDELRQRVERLTEKHVPRGGCACSHCSGAEWRMLVYFLPVLESFNSVVANAQAVLQEYYRSPDRKIELDHLERALDEATPDWRQTLPPNVQ